MVSKTEPSQIPETPGTLSETAILRNKARAIDRAQAVIEFDLKGQAVGANENFLTLMGYSLAEIRGKPHTMFCEPTYADSKDYADFWAHLRAGEYHDGEFKRIGRGGREVWIRASYNPLLDDDGKVVGVIKYAMDITRSKEETAEHVGKVTAISRAMAV